MMRLKTAVLLSALICLLLALRPAVAKRSVPRSTQQIGNVKMEAVEFTYARPDKITALGDVDLQGKDKATSSSYSAHAAKIIITLGRTLRAKGQSSALGAIKNADLLGPVTVHYDAPKVITDGSAKPKSQVITKTVVTADNATFDGAQNVAHFTGHVVITYFDPSTMEQPSVATGETATLNLNANLSSDQFAFKIETPGGLSKIEIVPKSEAPTKK